MTRKILSSLSALALLVSFASTQALAAAEININSPTWLGSLKLEKKQLSKIKDAVSQALSSPIDAEQQCGNVSLDCVVRAAREWKVGDDTYREVVIHIHTVGHTSHAISQSGGKWPAIVAK
ncbi:MAG: hypothetical protein OEX00_04245 [Gammaproteobacteria bacterium]|nr:hypothetical protein [Gammaproteobacteria bacterium]